MRFRGEKAISAGESGQGLGLYSARRLCEAYGAGLFYEALDSNDKNLAWHTFVIDIPRKLIFQMEA